MRVEKREHGQRKANRQRERAFGDEEGLINPQERIL
jgi:hypothetical protein